MTQNGRLSGGDSTKTTSTCDGVDRPGLASPSNPATACPRTSSTLFGDPGDAFEIARQAIHLPAWLRLEQQQHLVEAFDQWTSGPVPLRAAILPGGKHMSVQTVCLGWHWRPYHYSRTADDVNGAPVAPFPSWLGDLGRQALVAAGWSPDEAGAYRPDAALINYYATGAHLGMHQDKDERSDAPVVSFSVGDTARFRFGNTTNRNKPYTDIELEGGDAFVFGGASRLAYHGVLSTRPDTGEPASGLTSGRLNITMRVTGLS